MKLSIKINKNLIEETENVAIVFCYIFSFYIAGPITSSLLAAFFLTIYLFLFPTKQRWMFQNFKHIFAIKILLIQLFIIGIAFLYSYTHLTFDLSYAKVMFGQTIHLIAGIVIVTYLKYQRHFDELKIEKTIVTAFFIQSIIQIIALGMPSFATLLTHFNRAEDLQEGYGGVRGLALAAGSGWSLGLSYGLTYIIFTKRYLLQKIHTKTIIIGIILLIGTFFAGRTGFVGAGLGILLFFLSKEQKTSSKFSLVFKILFLIIIFCGIFYLLFPTLADFVIDNVLPFAFEPFYKLYYGEGFSTGSTNKLGEMWQVPISLKEILIGDGLFTDPTWGYYYKRTDVGILRNLLYWGVVGYLIIIAYQLFLIHPIKHVKTISVISPRSMHLYKHMIIIYLFALEFKAMTVGFNKMTFSIIFLVSYFYFEDYHKKNGAQYAYHDYLPDIRP